MKIVIIDKYDSMKISGTLMFTERLMRYLATHDHEGFVLRFSNEKKLPKHVFPVPFHVAEPRSYIIVPSEKTHRIIVNYLKKIKPDIVYSYCGISPFDFILPSVCHSLGIPIAAVWHQDFNYSPNAIQFIAKALFWMYVPVCDASDLLHVFSDKLKKFYVRRGIDKEKIITLPNGVNPDFYKPGRSEFAIHHSIKTGILFLGRLTLIKNPATLLSAFLRLNTPITTKLILVGHGDLVNTLQRQFNDPRIIFTGLVDNETKKRDIIRSCQIFVQPSINEGMSLALLESMACGLASITSDAGNNAELLDGAGTIIPIHRIEKDLARNLSYFLLHPRKVRSMGIQARKNILRSHVEESIYNNLIESLQKTINQFRVYSNNSFNSAASRN